MTDISTIDTLLKSGESQITEWKKSWRDEYLKWICGFANAQGGRLIIGMTDRGEVVGIENADKLMEDIPNKVRDILGIIVDVNLHQEKELKFFEIIVEPFPYPVSYKGQYHYRSGSTKQELKGAALDKFLLQKQGRTWDSVPVPHLKVEELSGIERFRKFTSKSKRFDEQILQEDDANLIDKLRLFDGKYLKRAALLLFHPDPEKYVTGAFIKIGFFENNSELLYQDEIHGSLFEQAEKTIDILTTKYLRAMISYEGIYRQERLSIPKDALREAILNAVVHKDYSSNVPIQISVYGDKLMIWNSGQLHEGWTVENLLQKHASAPYNPDIANAFFRAGLIEAWGRGIEKIASACENEGLSAPQFLYETGGLWVRFTLSDDVSVGKASGKRRGNVGKTSGRILEACREKSSITIPEIAELIGITERSIQRNMQKLQADGLLRRVGGRREGYWETIDE